MNEEDRIADGLETGELAELGPEQQEHLAELRVALSSEAVWEDPPEELRDRIISDIRSPRPAGRNWLLAVAAAIVLVLGTVGVVRLLDEDRPPSVATVALAGTELAPAASGTAELIPTPNGWAIAFDARGLPPAAEGTYYEAWVDNGENGVAIGTFHLRGQVPTPIALWSGVDLREYRTINVTIQSEGGGTRPSDELVLTGTAVEFEDD